jgi:DNA polymerase-3 subunit gamma/tau
MLNALAEACVANDNAAALTLMDSILESGVAIEQFVIDLATYCRSLLLLKSGVTKESLLGYSPERFSAPALERWDTVRIEQGLSIILDLYRDIRYSLSPRYELETALSKLCWLDKWISPAELSSAVNSLRNTLFPGNPSSGSPINAGSANNASAGSADNTSGLGNPALANNARAAASYPAQNPDTVKKNEDFPQDDDDFPPWREPERPFPKAGNAPADNTDNGETFNLSTPGSLSAAFKKRIAARTAGTSAAQESPPPEANRTLPPNGQIAANDTENTALELVRQMFRGTIVKEA